jgi:ubiquinol-cytochrome c reductase cytochrome c subunit
MKRSRSGRTAAGAALAATGLCLIVSAAVAGAQAPAPPPAPGPAPPPAPATPPAPASDVRAGHDLFQVACSSCHGLNGEGTKRGPTLVGVGAASADFYLSTGRMPLDNPGVQPERKRPAYTARQIRQLVAYVASLGPGAAIPVIEGKGDLVEGNQLYANNCASCHSSAGAGGALGKSAYAPRLSRSTPVQVAEAVRIGPGPMPRFGPETFDDHQVAAIVRYVQYLHRPDDRGGHGLGHLGPIPEGFVAWVVGLGLIVVAIRWIGTRD